MYVKGSKMIEVCQKMCENGVTVWRKLERKGLYRANEDANRRRGRPQRRWKEEMRELLMGKGFSNRAVLLLARDRDVYNLGGG